MSQRQRLEALTTEQLRREARAAGFSGVVSLQKAELIDRLEAQPKEAAAEAAAAPATPTPAASSLLGGLMQAAGVIGLVVSLLLGLAAPVLGWRLGQRASQQLAAAAATSRSLATTFNHTHSSLASGAASLTSAGQALETVELSAINLEPLLESVGTLLGDELPGTIRTTQSALTAAEQGAAAMDRVLRGLAFFGLEYNPSQPLDESLAQTAESLSPLPQALALVEGDLRRSQADVQLLTADIALLVTDLDELAQDLETTADGLETYSDVLDQLAESLDVWAGRSLWLGPVIGVAGLLVGAWSALVQLALIEVGKGLSMGRLPPD
jgi:hypothetical protein